MTSTEAPITTLDGLVEREEAAFLARALGLYWPF